MRGMQRFGGVAVAILAMGALGRTARADDAAPAPTPKTLEQRVQDIEKKIDLTNPAATLGISVHGLVAVDYLYDINRPTSGGPTLRSFENEKNSFILNQANLHFERQPDSGLGFVSDVNFGKTADVVNNTTFFGRHCSNSDVTNGVCSRPGDPLPGNGTDFVDVTQFYLTYTVPVGSGIKLKAGRFVTLAGAEVIKAYNNMNYNVTNSILFGFAIPFTHTGLMASYAFSDLVSLDLGLVNGWDTVADNNDGKSVHSGLTLAFSPKFTIYQTLTYGPEQSAHIVTDENGTPLVVHPGRSKRLLLTTLVTAKPTDALTLILDYDYGNDSDSVPRSGALHTAQWNGAAGYVIYAFTDSLSAALRAEIFDDMDGARVLGVSNNGGVGTAATYYEFTPTITYKVTDGLFWRNEYRHDESDSKKAFPIHSGSGFARGQDTLATELIYSF